LTEEQWKMLQSCIATIPAKYFHSLMVNAREVRFRLQYGEVFYQYTLSMLDLDNLKYIQMRIGFELDKMIKALNDS
jgi:hypothetical protein